METNRNTANKMDPRQFLKLIEVTYDRMKTIGFDKQDIKCFIQGLEECLEIDKDFE